LRHERLLDRKQELKRVLGKGSPVIYADYVEGSGIALFEKACALDLEGIVAKHQHAPYAPDRESTWFKIRNASYSQWAVNAGEKGSHFRRSKPEPGSQLGMIQREPPLSGTR
jgi:ATP-dependent DNA ligase